MKTEKRRGEERRTEGAAALWNLYLRGQPMSGLRDSEGGVDRETHARASEQQAPKDGFKTKKGMRELGACCSTGGSVCVLCKAALFLGDSDAFSSISGSLQKDFEHKMGFSALSRGHSHAKIHEVDTKNRQLFGRLGFLGWGGVGWGGVDLC